MSYMINKFKPEDLLNIDMLNPKAQQARFQAAYLKFLASNEYSHNNLGAGVCFIVAVASLLSLISFWVPFSISLFYLFRTMFKANEAAKKNLTAYDKRFLAFMKTEEEND